jgi:hypothetical protein
MVPGAARMLDRPAAHVEVCRKTTARRLSCESRLVFIRPIVMLGTEAKTKPTALEFKELCVILVYYLLSGMTLGIVIAPIVVLGGVGLVKSVYGLPLTIQSLTAILVIFARRPYCPHGLCRSDSDRTANHSTKIEADPFGQKVVRKEMKRARLLDPVEHAFVREIVADRDGIADVL